MKLFIDARYITPPYPDYIDLHAFKATQGVGWKNSILTEQISGATEYWLFHYHLGVADALRQAQWFVSIAGQYSPTELVLDVEDPNASSVGLGTKVRNCLLEIERLTGKKPILYTRASYWDYKIGKVSWINEYRLWLAHYGVRVPRLPLGATGYYAHQFMGDVNFPGYNQKVDINVLKD